jgi:hypothetical protein
MIRARMRFLQDLPRQVRGDRQRHIAFHFEGLQGKVDALKALQAQMQACCAVDALLARVFLYQDRRRQRLKERNGYGWQIHSA